MTPIPKCPCRGCPEEMVNAEPRQGACQCGRIYHYQWFRDGVEIEFEATP